MRRADRQIGDIAELKNILDTADACRIAMVDDGEPYITALSYGYAWDGELPVLYFHCAKEGRKLDIIRKKAEVCFMVDCDHQLVSGERGCDWGMKFRSLVGWGRLEFVQDAAEKKRGLDLLMRHYTGREGFSYDERVFAATEVLRLAATELTGKKKG